jgi:uncharacterized protein (TIGR02147 family)
MDAQNHPQVRSYLDAYQFLQDVYQHRKSLSTAEKKFSYEVWAQQMGLTSKSYLRFAVLGQRGISPELTQKISDNLGFEGLDKEYFSLLVLYTQTRQREQRALLGRRLTKLLRSESTMTEIRPTGILSDPLTIAVRNLLSFNDIPRTEEFLHKQLEINPGELAQILEKLRSENLIEKQGAEWVATSEDIKVSDKDHSETLLYHKNCLLKAIEAQAKSPQERHFRSVGLAMTGEEYQRYLEQLDQFIKTVFADFNGDRFGQKRLYQLNFNLFPWTSPAGEPV